MNNTYKYIRKYGNKVLLQAVEHTALVWFVYLSFWVILSSAIDFLSIYQDYDNFSSRIDNRYKLGISFIPNLFKFDSGAITAFAALLLTLLINIRSVNDNYLSLNDSDKAVASAYRKFGEFSINILGVLFFANFVYGVYINSTSNSYLEYGNKLYSLSYIWVFLFLSAFILMVSKINKEYPKKYKDSVDACFRRLIREEENAGSLHDYLVQIDLNKNMFRKVFSYRTAFSWNLRYKGNWYGFTWIFAFNSVASLCFVVIVYGFTPISDIGNNKMIIVILLSSAYMGVVSIFIWFMFLYVVQKLGMLPLQIVGAVILVLIISLINFAFYYAPIYYLYKDYNLCNGIDFNIISTFMGVTSIISAVFGGAVFTYYLSRTYKYLARGECLKNFGIGNIFHLHRIWLLWIKAQELYKKELFFNGENYSDLKILCRYWSIYNEQNKIRIENISKGNDVFIPWRGVK